MTSETDPDILLDALPYPEIRQRLLHALADAGRMPARILRRARFSPTLSYGRHFGPPAPTARQAAVMILVEPRQGLWTIPLTVRPDHLPDHPGQVSLPGGRLEGSETHQQAAEREFLEELGCECFPGEVLGELTPLYVYHSDYYVRSFVAVSDYGPDLQPCPREVASVVHLPLGCLVGDAHMGQQNFVRGLAHWSAPTIEFGGTTVWGATAIILGELSALLLEELSDG